MPTQRKSSVSDTQLLQQITKEVAAMKALLIDLVTDLKKTQAWMKRLANRVSELEKEKRDTSSALRTGVIPSNSPCEKTSGGVILHGKKIPLPPDATDVLYHLANANGIVSTEDLAVLCKPKNKLMIGETLQPRAIYQRLRRLKIALNNYHPDLGKNCVLSIPRKKFGPDGKTIKQGGIANDYRFDAEAFRAMLGIK